MTFLPWKYPLLVLFLWLSVTVRLTTHAWLFVPLPLKLRKGVSSTSQPWKDSAQSSPRNYGIQMQTTRIQSSLTPVSRCFLSSSLSAHSDSDLETPTMCSSRNSPTVCNRETSSQLDLSRGAFLSQLFYSGLLSLFVAVASWSSPVFAEESDSSMSTAAASLEGNGEDLSRSNVLNENDTTLSAPSTTSVATNINQTAPSFGNLLSVWTKPMTTPLGSSQQGEQHRVIYLLATAECQATTYQGPAEELVQQVLPDGVFVQLDPKRLLNPSNDAFLRKLQDAVHRHDTRIVVPTVDLKDDHDDKEWFLTKSDMDPQPTPPQPPHKRQPRQPWWQSLLSMGREFYDMALGRNPSIGLNLCAANVDALAAMDQGLRLGSKLILGDEDTDVMLTQMLYAIQVSIERDHGNEDVPPISGTGTNEGPVEKGIKSIRDGLDSMDAIQASLTLSERLKVRTPELYQVVYARRSKYMAKALDELNTYGSLVAIVGVSHVEAMKKLLQEKGWTEETSRTTTPSLHYF